MKKLLCISANSKSEELSVSKTVGREFIKQFMAKNEDYELDELDLYNEYIPELNHIYFKTRRQLVEGKDYDVLSDEGKGAIDRMNELCDQFMCADMFVITAPMWNRMFPSRLKRYIDCIVLNGKMIIISDEKEEKGLLDDKERKIIFIQTSGQEYPKLFAGKINHGVDYLHDFFKFLGIKQFYKIQVEGTDMKDIGKKDAIQKAYGEINKLMMKM